jgi:hypothetical protein
MARVKAASDLRKAHAQEELTPLITTQLLLTLCAWLSRCSRFQRAISGCILNRVQQEGVRVIPQTFDHRVGPLRTKTGGP